MLSVAKDRIRRTSSGVRRQLYVHLLLFYQWVVGWVASPLHCTVMPVLEDCQVYPGTPRSEVAQLNGPSTGVSGEF